MQYMLGPTNLKKEGMHATVWRRLCASVAYRPACWTFLSALSFRWRMATLDERRAAKTGVLSKVNSVLVNAGLNDTVWSIRDCDSTLFMLMYKKLVGKV